MAEAVSSSNDLVLSDSEVSSTIVNDDQSAVVVAMADSMSEITDNNPNQEVHLSTENPTISVANQNLNILGSTDNATLQSLLSQTSAGQIFTQNDGIQIITVANPVDLLGTNHGSGNRVWQIVPGSSPEIATIVAVPDSDFETEAGPGTTEASPVVSSNPVPNLLLPAVTPATSRAQNWTLPPNCPAWAARLKCCEQIGDSYRGYVDSEVELDLLLTYHKQQTQSFWGTRQSPSQSRVSTRLMWKSQYVPFDGIPFINTGSRAVVMECQYGPRRKGCPQKKDDNLQLEPGEYRSLNPLVLPSSSTNKFRKTCPARIYIKKVKKFVQYAVDPDSDRKTLKMSMDKSFQALRGRLDVVAGQERFYVQLPTEQAHEFHNPQEAEIRDESSRRLHPQVVAKIRQLVADGETRLYAIRKAVRVYVVRDLFSGRDQVPERHDLTYFPTVNDLKNHIHAAVKDLANGDLAFTGSSVNLEVLGNTESGSEEHVTEVKQVDNTIWPQASGDGAAATPETVTVTLTQHPGEDGHHVISRIETHLSDGTTHISDTLTPETAQLLSTLHPVMFPGGCDGVIKIHAFDNQQEKSEPATQEEGTQESETLVDDNLVTQGSTPDPEEDNSEDNLVLEEEPALEDGSLKEIMEDEAQL